MLQRYWMVHNVIGHAPTVKHPSKTQARKEARRLADQNPGIAFAVLEVIDAYLKPQGTTRIPISECSGPDDEQLPF